jgi:hypothetical protein
VNIDQDRFGYTIYGTVAVLIPKKRIATAFADFQLQLKAVNIAPVRALFFVLLQQRGRRR